MIKLNKNILIAFSGGCFSGKTTTLNRLSQYLSDRGYPVEVIKERARELMPSCYDGNIDLLRKNAKDYLKFEIDIISKKILDEEDALSGKQKKIYLIDRALTDSLFYLETYIDIKSLDIESAKEFTNFHKKLLDKLAVVTRKWQKRYSIVFEFKPIENNINNDTFRPSNIDVIKYYEHNRIKQINSEYLERNTFLYRPDKYDDITTAEDLFNYVRVRVEDLLSVYKNNNYGTEI